MSPRVLFAAGGTGGHVFPALAVADALRARDPRSRIEFAGGRRGIEGDLVPRAGYLLHRLPAAGMRGLGPMGALRFTCNFVLALIASLTLILRLRPDVVLATGGYASAAPAMAAALLGRPLWLQEQNSVPGSTNRVLARRAERVYVAYEEARGPLAAAGELRNLPNPLRAGLDGRPPSPADYENFGLAPGRPTLLLFGGSRGAHTLNRALGEAASRLAQTEWQLIAQTGEADYAEIREKVETVAPDRFVVRPFLREMDRAYRIADLVVCRAGAMTLAELAVVGRPAILVPFPHATDDHQTHNAGAHAASGAAEVIADSEFDGEKLLARLASRGRLAAMREAAEKLKPREPAADRLALDLLERAGVKA